MVYKLPLAYEICNWNKLYHSSCHEMLHLYKPLRKKKKTTIT